MLTSCVAVGDWVRVNVHDGVPILADVLYVRAGFSAGTARRIFTSAGEFSETNVFEARSARVAE